MEIDLNEKIKQLESEVDEEIEERNRKRQETWDEFFQNGCSLQPQKTDDTPLTLDDIHAEVLTKEEFSDTETWGLVLAGGGGKGSYQIGVWKALRELGVMKNVKAVSGASVGALNAALISMGDYDTAEDIWKNILPDQFLDINDEAILGSLSGFYDRGEKEGVCTREGLSYILNEKVNIPALANPTIDAYTCIAQYPNDSTDFMNVKPVAEYIRLCEVTGEDAKQILLASSAMPFIYPPEIIHGKLYRDGGLADNVPIKPLVPLGLDKLIVVKLGKETKADTYLYSSFKEVIEIAPSRPIGDFFDGTIDFHKRNVLYRMLLGYYDTLRTFGIRMYKLNGLPVNTSEILRREEADYEKIMGMVSRDKAISSVSNNMNKLNDLINKYK